MFESQSKTVSLLQPSVPQVPLFWQPLGWPPLEVEHPLHPIIFYILKYRPPRQHGIED